MDAYTAANKAFGKCKSRFPKKNQSCAPFLAKQYLISAGVRGEELEASVEHVHRLLDEWYAQKATNKAFFPQPVEADDDEREVVAHNVISSPIHRLSDAEKQDYLQTSADTATQGS